MTIHPDGVTAQEGDIREYQLRTQQLQGALHPEDCAQLRRTLRELRDGPATLAFCYNFVPFQDTGAITAAKRIRLAAQPTDVIACDFTGHKLTDPTSHRIAEDWVRDVSFLPLKPVWDHPQGVRDFAQQAHARAAELIREGAVFTQVYSRAMWAASHVAAAVFKLEHPEIPWRAEFSDPLSLDIHGAPRGAEIPAGDPWFLALLERVQAALPGVVLPRLNVMQLAEYVAYVLADELVFTNASQLQVMVDAIAVPEVQALVQHKSVVAPHPTLPQEAYGLCAAPVAIPQEGIHIGYFGEFYASRGLTEVTAAMARLPQGLREQVHLHVFTSFVPGEGGDGRERLDPRRRAELEAMVGASLGDVAALERQIHVHAALPYLEFLAATQQFDVLVVADANAAGAFPVNPFLPSKWSDYRGSAATTWAIVDAGSELAAAIAQVEGVLSSPLGDIDAALAVLLSIADAKQDRAGVVEDEVQVAQVTAQGQPWGVLTGQPEGISVLLATKDGHERVPAMLDSLAAQTLPRQLWELVVVDNGVPGGVEGPVAAVLQEWESQHPGVRVQYVAMEEAGVAGARNRALAMAAGAYVTFVDDDDYLEPDFLRSMWCSAGGDAVVVAPLSDDTGDGSLQRETVTTQRVRQLGGRTVPLVNVPELVGLNAAKLIPRTLAQHIVYDPRLRSGEDVVALSALLSIPGVRVRAAAQASNAGEQEPQQGQRQVQRGSYVRVVRKGSVSRQEADAFDFHVLQRIAVMNALVARRGTGHVPAAVTSLIRSQAQFLARFVAQQPEERLRVVEAVQQRCVIAHEILDYLQLS